MQIQETQAENTTPLQATAGDDAPEFDGTPAREVTHLQLKTLPDIYAVTLEDGEVLDVSLSAHVATLAYALNTGRRVLVGSDETQLVAVRLDQAPPMRLDDQDAQGDR